MAAIRIARGCRIREGERTRGRDAFQTWQAIPSLAKAEKQRSSRCSPVLWRALIPGANRGLPVKHTPLDILSASAQLRGSTECCLASLVNQACPACRSETWFSFMSFLNLQYDRLQGIWLEHQLDAPLSTHPVAAARLQVHRTAHSSLLPVDPSWQRPLLLEKANPSGSPRPLRRSSLMFLCLFVFNFAFFCLDLPF